MVTYGGISASRHFWATSGPPRGSRSAEIRSPMSEPQYTLVTDILVTNVSYIPLGKGGYYGGHI